MSMDDEQHRIRVRRTMDPLDIKGRPTGGVLANLYLTDAYMVLNVALPRCRPEHIQVTVSPTMILVEAEQHPAQEKMEQEREFILAELPFGSIRRAFPLPDANLELHAVEAHFGNGLLTVTIPTQTRDAFLHKMRGEDLPEES